MASQSPQPPENRGGFSRQAALAMELPFLIVGGALVGGFFGYLLDRYLHTKPYLMLVLGAAGFAVGVRDLIRRLGKDDGNGSGRSQQ
ncbi:MAG TPA: AtpZ/AtpI family protein [Terriglobales bacterium]|jgi:F0F1-type ATP synthase assembly protein I|nr:AtpZ/AtpI family protein [Terriglobales bacterium]